MTNLGKTGDQVLKFVFVGVLGAVTEIGLFIFLLQYELSLIWANALAFNIALAQCFIANQYLTFRQNTGDIGLKKFIVFLIYMYLQLIVGTIMLWFLIDVCKMPELISKVIQLGCLTPLSFVFQKYFVFKSE